MNYAILLSILDSVIALIIFIFGLKIYMEYKRKYLMWFLVGFVFFPLIFIYSIMEYYLSTMCAVLVYPIFVIIIEIFIILAEKNLLISIKKEEIEEYKILVREDIAILRVFERMANYLIRRLIPLVGRKSIEDIIEECSYTHDIISGVILSPKDTLDTSIIEEKIGDVTISDLLEAFTFLVEKIIDIYAALVPYEKIAEDIRKMIGEIENKKIIKWLVPFAVMKTVVEPVLRKCKPDELSWIRLSVSITGININRNGGIEMHEIYSYDYEEILDKITRFFSRAHFPLTRLLGVEVNKEITRNFRLLPDNVKEELYRTGFIKSLPRGILEEERITLMSRDKLVEELAERKKRLEEAYRRLSQAKLDRMKSNFIDMIAHELKTPLTVIKTYTELLRHEKLGELNEMQKDKLEKMAKNIERMNELINDMLQIPSIDAKELELRKENFYIKDVIEDIVNELREIAEEKKQKIELNLDKSMVTGDRTLIERAIKNIVSNAIKYTPEGGKIAIESRKGRGYVHIKIKDTGKGIKKSDIEKIFEPFYSRHGGAGLGLAIAKNIVESHGGKIWAESEYGKGAVFHIKFKLARGET
ncbi:MAG: HAMP domain-containing histidine kinase [Thermoplasmata archaeon]|nr:HAMP domain-containing histidine kinase [Thermoplasmata archaeon]